MLEDATIVQSLSLHSLRRDLVLVMNQDLCGSSIVLRQISQGELSQD
ncbi:protein of unknown function [Legionella fallonii LLAP-10]|uniref:Uncharacterized protein n=1 Tax=Legionella fallonii LLAP-10 TaxID=1212491 RepID=A0A098G862_9GAMM|nr:protein of unknown function [Legionella fallonii LLAP-10]